ncbi:hypothetical protein D3C76_1802440 [compost metagenome]
MQLGLQLPGQMLAEFIGLGFVPVGGSVRQDHLDIMAFLAIVFFRAHAGNDIPVGFMITFQIKPAILAFGCGFD